MGKEQRHSVKSDGNGLSLSELRKRYQHDEFCKDNLRDLNKARKFLKWMFKPEIVELLDIERLELSSESFLDEELKKLYADVLYRIPVKDSDESVVVFVLIELKTESDKWTVFQQVKYIIRIWDQEYRKAETEERLGQFLLPMVIPVIFHHGENRFTASTELIDQVRTVQGLEPYTLNVRSLLLDVMTLHEEDFPTDLELNVLFMILQAAFSKDVATRLMKIYEKLRPNLHEPAVRRQWEDCLYYALSSAKNFTGQDCRAIVTEIRNTGDTIMSTTFVSAAEQLAAEAKAETVLKILRAKFNRIPKETEKAICQMTDLIALDSLAVHAAQSKSLAEFADALK